MKSRFYAVNDVLGQSQVMVRNPPGGYHKRGTFNEYDMMGSRGQTSQFMSRLEKKYQKQFEGIRPRTTLTQQHQGFFAGSSSSFFQDPEFNFSTKKKVGSGSNPAKKEHDNHRPNNGKVKEENETSTKRPNPFPDLKQKKKMKPPIKRKAEDDVFRKRKKRSRQEF